MSQHRRAHEKLAAHPSPGGKGKISGIYLTVIDRLADEDTFVSDDGTSTVWLHRHVRAKGKRRMYASQLHGTMGGGYATALGLKKSQPGLQVIALVGDGG